MGQAGDVSRLFTQNIQDSLAKLSQIGQFDTQGTLSATGGVQQSADQLGQLSAARANAAAAGFGGLASAIGTYFGMRGAPAHT